MTDSNALAQAQQRLAQSRQRLREALGGLAPGAAAPHGQGASHGSTGPAPRAAAAGATLGWLPELALSLGNRALAPTALRHPWWLVLGAGSLGAAMAAGRPWRWAPQVLLVTGALRPWWQPMLLRAAARLTLGRLAPHGAASAEQRPQ
jgi:hypothetical protein